MFTRNICHVSPSYSKILSSCISFILRRLLLILNVSSSCSRRRSMLRDCDPGLAPLSAEVKWRFRPYVREWRKEKRKEGMKGWILKRETCGKASCILPGFPWNAMCFPLSTHGCAAYISHKNNNPHSPSAAILPTPAAFLPVCSCACLELLNVDACPPFGIPHWQLPFLISCIPYVFLCCISDVYPNFVYLTRVLILLSLSHVAGIWVWNQTAAR